MNRMDKLDLILRDATEPLAPDGYWEEMKSAVMQKVQPARRGRARVLTVFRWAGAVAAMILLTFACAQLALMRSMMTEIRQGTDPAVVKMITMAPSEVRTYSAAAIEIDQFLGGRARVVATDGSLAELQTNGFRYAARSEPMIVRFAVFQKTRRAFKLISSPTIAILRGNAARIRFRAERESLSVEYQCFDIISGRDGVLLPCRVSIISASGRTCELKASPYLRHGSVSKIGSVTAGEATYEVFVGYPQEKDEDDTSRI